MTIISSRPPRYYWHQQLKKKKTSLRLWQNRSIGQIKRIKLSQYITPIRKKVIKTLFFPPYNRPLVTNWYGHKTLYIYKESFIFLYETIYELGKTLTRNSILFFLFDNNSLEAFCYWLSKPYLTLVLYFCKVSFFSSFVSHNYTVNCC